jgi:type IV pilus assembly protein PilP
MMMKCNRRILMCLFSLLLSSCSGDNNDLSRYIHQIKQRKSRAIAPLPTFAPVPPFKFPEVENRRNPFKPMNPQKFVDPYAPDQRRIKQPLEAYPLDALKFVGTLTQDNQIWGLIKLPDGQITRVRIGDYMGQNYGRILIIKNNSVKLEETIKGSSGKWEKHMTTVDLYTGK